MSPLDVLMMEKCTHADLGLIDAVDFHPRAVLDASMWKLEPGAAIGHRRMDRRLTLSPHDSMHLHLH